MAASMIVDQENNRYIYKSDSSTNNYNYAVTFNTANTFVDKNIRVQIHPGSISPYFENTNLATFFDAGTAGSNSISITPKATATNGFVNTLTSSNAQTGTAQYYTIKQAVVATDTADVTLFSTDGSNAGLNISAIVGTKTTTEPSSGYYLAFKGSGNSKITTAGWVATGSLTSTTSEAKYFPITAAEVTHSGGGISITTNYSGTPTVSATLTDQTTTGVALTTTQPTNGFYLTITSNSTALSGKTKATRAAYTETFTAGYLPAKSSTNILSSSAVEPTVTINPGSAVSYLTIPTASVTYAGGALNNKTASADFANITTSTTDNGIYVQTKGTAGRDSVTYTNTAGWLAAHSSATNASSAVSSSTWNGTKYYITAVTVPKDIAFSVTTVEDTALDTTSNLTITNAAYRQASITNAGNITTTQSAKSGTIKINAYDTSSSSSLAGEKTIVENGAWKTTTITTKPSNATAYYGRVYVNLNTTSVDTSGVTTVSGTTATRPTATWGNGWITSGSISAAVFGNTVASGKTDSSYVDISATTAAPVLTAGGYLYINKGFTDNVKISLAKLVPDSISNVEIATSEWIHPSYGAFDANGNAIQGTMTVYAGAYTLET